MRVFRKKNCFFDRLQYSHRQVNVLVLIHYIKFITSIDIDFDVYCFIVSISLCCKDTTIFLFTSFLIKKNLTGFYSCQVFLREGITSRLFRSPLYLITSPDFVSNRD